MRRTVAIILAGLVLAAGARAQKVAPKAYAFSTSGSYLGVGVQEIDSTRAKELKLKEEYGVEITRVTPDSPAAKAGLKEGDALLHYNGQRIEGIEQFQRFVRETPVGREVKLDVWRGGAQQTIAAKIGERSGAKILTDTWINMPKVEIPQIHIPDIPRSSMFWSSGRLGVETESLTGQLADFFGVKEGVLVRSVHKGSAAEKAGLKAGDVITKVDGDAVSSPGAVSSIVRTMRSGKAFPVVVVRDKREHTLTVTIDDDREPQKRAVRQL